MGRYASIGTISIGASGLKKLRSWANHELTFLEGASNQGICYG